MTRIGGAFSQTETIALDLLSDVTLTSPSDDQVLAYDTATGEWINQNQSGGGATDHGALTGLADDDHTQYLLADGTRDLAVTATIGGNTFIHDATTNYVTLTDSSDADALHTHTGANLTDDTFVLNTGDIMTGNLFMDDGSGDSPIIAFFGGTNNDRVNIILRDDATAGRSDLAITLAGKVGAQFIIEDDDGADKFTVDGLGNVVITNGLNISGDLDVAGTFETDSGVFTTIETGAITGIAANEIFMWSVLM